MSATAENLRQAAPESGIAAWLTVTARLGRLASCVIAGVVAAPILVVALAWLTPAGDVWRHLVHTVLGELLRHTAVLMFGGGLGVFVLGARLAWVVAMCEFP